MPTPNELLATSLQALRDLGSARALPARALSRVHRQRLSKAGFLTEVVKGWYIQSRPNTAEGDSTAWYASMLEFLAGYCNERFKEEWHVGPDQSLMLRSGERSLPTQVQLWSPQANNQVLQLPHATSAVLYRAPKLLPAQPSPDAGGLRLVEIPAALIAASPAFYVQQPLAANIALTSLRDASDLARSLLEGGHSTIAGRLAGALRHIGRGNLADEVLAAMRAAGYTVVEANPFEKPVAVLPGGRPESPYVARLRLMWGEMRGVVAQTMPPPNESRRSVDAILADVDARYVADAYNSLSIEGYRVTAELIEKVRTGSWDPDGDDRESRDAMAAKGYFEAHKEVKATVARIVGGANPGTELRAAHSSWYRALFSPSVQAGLLKPEDLAGYRNDQVFIRGALHVPLPKDAVRETMPVLFELVGQEENAAVRAVLGHFFFVYIHPYMDGNGRLARFLMNCLLASGGYPWTVIPVERRAEYMGALEQASSHGNIGPFAGFVAALVVAQRNEPPKRSNREVRPQA